MFSIICVCTTTFEVDIPLLNRCFQQSIVWITLKPLLCLNNIFSHQKAILYQHTIQIFPLFWKFATMKLATLVEDDLKAPFSIATTLRCRAGTTPFSGLLHFTLDAYLIMLSVKAPSSPFFFFFFFFKSLVWLELGLNPGLPDHWWTLNSLSHVICKLMIQLGSNFETCRLKVSSL